MMYASEDLINEHKGILLGIAILEKMVAIVKSNGIFKIDDAKEMINFFKLFADKCHHGKEEILLFPEMEKAGIPNEHGPIGQMLLEHNEGRKCIKTMEEGINDSKVDTFINAASKYIDLLRHHIEKENTILFPMADRRIPLDIQNNLLELFEKHEKDVMGEGIHEKLHDLLHTMEKKYL